MPGVARGKYERSLNSPHSLIQTAKCVQQHFHSVYDSAIDKVVRSLTPSRYGSGASNREHDRLIADVIDRIRGSGDYCFIMSNQTYFGCCDDSKIRNGELDVFGIGYEDVDPFFSYFEIKSGHNPTSVRKASEQFSRWRSYMHATHRVPDENLDTVLITPVTLNLELPRH